MPQSPALFVRNTVFTAYGLCIIGTRCAIFEFTLNTVDMKQKYGIRIPGIALDITGHVAGIRTRFPLGSGDGKIYFAICCDFYDSPPVNTL